MKFQHELLQHRLRNEMSYSAKLKEQLKNPTGDGEVYIEGPNEEKIAELEEEVPTLFFFIENLR